MDVRFWPGAGLRRGRRKLTSTGEVVESKVRFLARPRIHATGHERPFSEVCFQAVRWGEFPSEAPYTAVDLSRPPWPTWAGSRTGSDVLAEVAALLESGGPGFKDDVPVFWVATPRCFEFSS